MPAITCQIEWFNVALKHVINLLSDGTSASLTVPQPAKKRASQACQQCRLRKVKCVIVEKGHSVPQLSSRWH